MGRASGSGHDTGRGEPRPCSMATAAGCRTGPTRRSFRAAVLKQVKARYEDFGATLACEHLASDDGVHVPAETLRRWRREAGWWQGQRRRKPYRQRREAKAHFGELVQLDGSFHEWLEERGSRGCLMHMVDD